VTQKNEKSFEENEEVGKKLLPGRGSPTTSIQYFAYSAIRKLGPRVVTGDWGQSRKRGVHKVRPKATGPCTRQMVAIQNDASQEKLQLQQTTDY